MKLKIFILVAAIAMIGISVIVIVRQSRSQQVKFAPPSNQLPTAISNYSKTFKLNTSPPLWPDAKGLTNGSTNH